MTQRNLQEIGQEMKQLEMDRLSDENDRPMLTIGELYGCLCHQPIDRLPAPNPTADQH